MIELQTHFYIRRNMEADVNFDEPSAVRSTSERACIASVTTSEPIPDTGDNPSIALVAILIIMPAFLTQ